MKYINKSVYATVNSRGELIAISKHPDESDLETHQINRNTTIGALEMMFNEHEIKIILGYYFELNG